MKSPSSSSKAITGSQAWGMAANNSTPISFRKIEESQKGVAKSMSALTDITNDSPIVGLAIGSSKTPSSTFAKRRRFVQSSESKQPITPGSGEALLRGQVKTLLQKVEEEAVIPKILFEPKSLIHEHGGLNSAMYLLAPTPANTPQVSEFRENHSSPVVAESFDFSQKIGQQEYNDETLKTNLLTKLFTDFPEKLEHCESYNEDDASVWSVQVNVSTSDEELEDNCEVLGKLCVNDDGAKFTRKHLRFVYDSDELEDEKDV